MFSACPSDDDDEESNKADNVLVGYWNISNFDYHMVLFNGGKMASCTTNKNGSIGSISVGNWSYDNQTSILATTAEKNGINLQWHLTMVNDDNWTGIALWDNKTTQKATNQIDAKEIAILLNGKWVNENGKLLTFYEIRDSYDKYDGQTIRLEYTSDDKPEVDMDGIHHKRKAIKFNRFKKDKNQIYLSFYDRDHDTDYYQGKTIEESYSLMINNPYSFDKRELQMYIYISTYRNKEIIQSYIFEAKKYTIEN